MLADGTEMVRLEATTLDGPLVGKHLSREKFERCLPDGVCMADFVLAMDLAGTPQLGWWGDWRRPALGDMYLRPDLTTGVTDPDSRDTMSFLGTFTALDGDPLPVCPARCCEPRPTASPPPATRCAAPSRSSSSSWRNRSPRPADEGSEDSPRSADPDHKMLYLTQRSPEFVPLMRSAIRRLEQMGIGWEAFNDEAAPGQFELNLAPSRPGDGGGLDGAGQAGSARRGVEHGVRSRSWPGRSRSTAAACTCTCRCGATAHPCSPKTAKRCATGSAERWSRWRGRRRSVSPTINSFRRQVDFAAVPTTPTWGEDNKGAAVRDDHPTRCVGPRRASVGGRRRQPLPRARHAILAGGLAG